MLRRTACVDVPELPLQLLLREHPDWRGGPVAVVPEQTPEAPLTWVNHQARQLRLRTGMRFGAAKSLVPALRAGSVSDLQIEQAIVDLVRDLQTFSPHVERDPNIEGVLYVDPSGLTALYGGEPNWARSVHSFLRGRRLQASVVVGHGRMLCYAMARQTRGVRVVASPQEAKRLGGQVPLERLHMHPKLRDGLERLGLTRLGDLEHFAADALGTRFTSEATAWCRVARGEETLPLCAQPHEDAPRRSVQVEPPDADVARLCFSIKRGLDDLLRDICPRGQSIKALWLTLKLEPAFARNASTRRDHSRDQGRVQRGDSYRGQSSAELESTMRLEPSRPTRDAALLLELIRLRLSAVQLHAPVEELVLEADMTRHAPGQLPMFAARRDRSAGERALSRLEASFGEGTVCRAQLEDAHLPEARFRWQRTVQVREPVPKLPGQEQSPPLVRRLLARPEPFDPSQCGRLVGPYRLSGGWWVREVERDYYYAELPDGLWWVFYDRPRDQWLRHGVVE